MRTRITLTVLAAAFVAIALATGAVAGAGKKPPKSHDKAAKLESRAMFSVLTGRNEVDADGRRGAAHIHAGRRNQSNPPLVPLTQPTTGDPGAASGCVDVDPTIAQAILKNPHKYYFNVHTAAFPNGAVRGQLARKSH